MKTKISAASLFIVIALIFCGCTSLVPDYEVMKVPQPVAQYRTGRAWVYKEGPTGVPMGHSTQAPGVTVLTSRKGRATKGRIEASFSEWASGILGLEGKSSVQISMTNLQHETVSDLYDLPEATPVLYETITASGFSLESGKNLAGDLSVDALGQKLKDATGGTVKFSVSNTNDNSYSVVSDKPVVVAIRVVFPEMRVNTESDFQRIDLSTPAVGKPQKFRLGYQLTLQEPVDPVKKMALVKIYNSYSPYYQGTNYLFIKNEPWVSPKRTSIAGKDKQLKDAQFVWDSISLSWAEALTNCQVQVERQYLTPVPVKSGLDTIR